MNMVSIGESCVDLYTEQERVFAGGISLNFALHAKESGADSVSLVSRTGDDPERGQLVGLLESRDINTSHVQRLIGQTATCEIALAENGERYYPPGGYKRGVLNDFVLTDQEWDFIETQDVVVSMFDHSHPFPFLEDLLRRPMRGKKVMDFGDWDDGRGDHRLVWPFLHRLDLAFVSGTEETIAAFSEYSRDIDGILVVTMGAMGSAAVHKGRISSAAAQTVQPVVDTTGCGDAFQAAFTVSYLRNGEISEALDAGSAKGAEVASYLGAFHPQIFNI